MLFQTTPAHEELRAKIRAFAEEEIKPLAFLLDQNNEFPDEPVKKMAQLGWLGLPFPKEYGGAGLDILSYAIAVEELARVDGGAGVILSAHVSLGAWPIFAYGTEEQKQKYLVPLARGEKLGAFGKFLHDTCNFKYLMVEKILQALYIFTTAAVIIFGVLMLFRTEYNYWTGDRIWMGGYGLLIIILGPIAIRLSYELMMMAILLLKNVISINHKLADQTGKGSGDVFAAPNMQEMKEALRQRREAAQAAQSQPANFCGQCGAKLENGVCPHCSAPKDSAPADSTPPQE